ncbi:MAG: hypothetical protein UT26_C0021G0002 [Microgenomates group bacterium GW2011_GWC1_39_12]|nr:MAG: hypothetical protein UT26_C0021G0002 [Microgenomates group bacterium GW2011_GWC1_39_12]
MDSDIYHVSFFSIHLPFRNIPAIADVPTYLNSAHTVYINRLNPFVEYVGYRPPLLLIATSILYFYFGESSQTATVFIFFLSSCALLLIYIVGKKLFSTRVAIISYLFLLFSPLFLQQSFLFQDPIAVMLLLLGSIYGYIASWKHLWVPKKKIFSLCILLFIITPT